MSKISELDPAGPLTGTEEVPLVQGGMTRRGFIGAHIASLAVPFVAQAEEARDITIASAATFYATKELGEAATTADAIFAVAPGDGTATYWKKGSPSQELFQMATKALVENILPLPASSVIANDGKSVADLFTSGVAAGAAMVPFLPKSISVSFQSLQDKLQGLPTLADYGGIGDGQAHTVQEWIVPGTYGRYADLAAVQVDFPHVTSPTNCANWAALLKLVSQAQAENWGFAKLGSGIWALTQQVNLSGSGITIIGVEDPDIQTGSNRTACTIRWLGGATSMFVNTTSSWNYYGFGIENGTVATCWLEMAAGAQRNIFWKLYAVVADQLNSFYFSRSLIYSNGNRLGYGGMLECVVNSIAPTIIEVQDNGTSNGITSFFLHRNQFRAATADMKVMRVVGETIELLGCTQNTVIHANYECCLLDTTDAPASSSINTLVVDRNEFDTTVTVNPVQPNWRFMRMSNIDNAAITSNHVYGGAQTTAAFDLINSHVTENGGNYFYSLNGYLYNPDATSTIAPGHNVRNTSNTSGDFDPAWIGNIGQPVFGGVMVLNPSAIPGEHKVFFCDITANTSYEIRCPASKPYWHRAGQIITVIIRNLSGGTISAGAFRSDTFNVDGALVAPADGFQRSYMFVFTGSKWTEISRTGDVVMS